MGAAARCDSCGHEMAGTANFCSNCGRPLSAGTVRSHPPATAPSAGAERRLLSVIFGDIVGSTALAERVDHEGYRDFLRAYYSVCADIVEHYEGHVAKHMGDGVLIYFGYPNAHDDDARRAILAALEIAAAVPALEWMLPGGEIEPPSVRIGIHSGLTVVGDVGVGATHEALAVGETPNIAARLQQTAVPGEVVISNATRRLADGYFALRSLGDHRLKGVSEPVAIFRVLGLVENPKPLRLDRDVFVGRVEELRLITDAYEAARHLQERFITISGEAGMGKSRLIEVTRETLGTATIRWVDAACSPFYRNTALFPIVQLIYAAAGMSAADRPEVKLRRIEALARATIPHHDEAVALIARLVGIDAPGHGILEYPSEILMRRTFEMLAALLRSLCSGEPAVVVIEDLHWADPSTLELLSLMIRTPADSALMMLLTHRPDLDLGALLAGKAPGPEADDRQAVTDERLTAITLAPLDSAAVEELIDRLTDDTPVPTGVIRDIMSRADGVPFFVEELVKSVHESPHVSAHDESARLPAIPVTLRGLLGAQLDRLGPAKRIAQLGAMLGRRFTVDLIEALRSDPIDVGAGLEQLVRADLVIAVASVDRPTYEFRHALIQEAAYDSLLWTDRRRMHGRIADAYEAGHVEMTKAHPEIVGHHWNMSGQHHRAAPYFKRAGDRSALAYATEEALAFYRQTVHSAEAVLAGGNEPGGPWVEMLVDVHERIGDILALRWRRDEAEAAYLSALQRCRDAIGAARLHRRIGVVHEQDRARAHKALELAEQALGPDTPERTTDWRREWIGIQVARMRMHYWYDEGNQMRALELRVRPFIERDATPLQQAKFIEQIVSLRFREERYAMSEESLRLAAEYVEVSEQVGDLTELASARFAYAFYLLFGGQPAQAVVQFEAALALTRRCGHRAIEIRCLSYLATAHRMLGHTDDAESFALRSRVEAMADQMIEYVGMAAGNLAWVALTRGDVPEALRLSSDAVATWNSGAMAWPFRWIGLLPMMVCAESAGDVEILADCARSMLDGVQQRLADAVAGPLGRLVGAFDRGDRDGVIAAAGEARRGATAAGLLAR